MSRIIISILFGIIIFQFSSSTPGGRYCSYVSPSEGRIICRLRCLEECQYESGLPDKSEHHCAQVVFEQNEVGTKSEYGCEAGYNTFFCEMQTHTESLIVIKFSHLEFQYIYSLSATDVQNGFLQSVHEYRVSPCLYKEQLEIISSTSNGFSTAGNNLSQTTRSQTAPTMYSSRMKGLILSILEITVMQFALF